MAALRYMSGKQLATQRSQRAETLAWIERQVLAGELIIRQATLEERERYCIGRARPIAPDPPRRIRTTLR